MPTTPQYAAFFYLFSNFLDAFDGMAARRFSQSKFECTYCAAQVDLPIEYVINKRALHDIYA